MISTFLSHFTNSKYFWKSHEFEKMFKLLQHVHTRMYVCKCATTPTFFAYDRNDHGLWHVEKAAT